MVKKNPGKAFEEDFKKSVPQNCWIYRFKDGTANFQGQKNENVRFQAKNICDFQVMTNEYLFLLELKSHAKVSIGFECIRENQIKQMSEIYHQKIKAYFIFNFRDMEKTFAIEAKKVKEYMETAERSSFPFKWCEENGIEIIGTKKKVRYKYDLEKFFNEMEATYEKAYEFKNERELQDDLAEHLRNSGMLSFTEIQIPNMHGSRADVIAMTPHRYTTKDIRLYEVKLTRGVWLADKKFQKYLECCNRMYIACIQGVIKKDELPAEIGLITRSDKGWRVAKSPRLNINPPKLDVDFILSLLYRGYEETKIQRDLRDRGIAESNYKLRDVAHRIGFDIGRRLDRTKDAKVEKWCDELWEVFKKFGVEAPGYKTDDLPSVYDIENLLGGASALMQDVATIKAIGTYLENIELPEIEEGRLAWRNRKDNREKALSLIGKEVTYERTK